MAVLDGKPRSASAIIVEKTDTLYLSRTDFIKFLKTSPQACIGIIEMLCGRLRRISRQLEELSFLDVSGIDSGNETYNKAVREYLKLVYNAPDTAEEILKAWETS